MWNFRITLASAYMLYYLLQLKDLRVGPQEEPCIRVNTRELNRELYTVLFTLYTLN